MSVRSFILGCFGKQQPTSTPICSESLFRSIIEREQRRCSRTGGMFTLVAFEVIAERQANRALHRAVSARLRATDAAGEIDGQIVILLPETSPIGATLLAKEIWQHVRRDQSPQLELVTFPESLEGAEAPANSAHRLLQSVSENEDAGRQRTAHEFAARPLPRWKRGFDIAAAAVGLLLVSPILAAAAIGIKLTSPGPILFTQMRTGHGGRRFKIYKLRTMFADAEKLKDQLRPQSEQDGPAFKMRNDPRITPIGRYLRKTAIDELPQLWNVLIGDMTIVGPRPLACNEADQCLDWQNERLHVVPGLTCSWQSASGRSTISFSNWMRMDIRYARSFGFWKDLRLIAKTIWAVLMHRASC